PPPAAAPATPPAPTSEAAVSASNLPARLLISPAAASWPESIPPLRSSLGPPHFGPATRIERQIEAAEVAARRPARIARLAGAESLSPSPLSEAPMPPE